MYPTLLSPLFPAIRTAVIAILLLFGAVMEGYGQRVRFYTNAYGTNTVLLSSVSNPEYALEPGIGDYAELTSVLLGSATLQLKFLIGNPIPSSVPAYVRLNTMSGHTIRAYQNADISTGGAVSGSVITPTTTNNTPSTNYVRLVSPTSYNAISIQISGINSKNVYHAYVEPIEFPLTFNQPTISACDGYNILEALNYNFNGLLSYEVLTSGGQVIQSSPYVITSGTYTIRAIDPNTNETKMSAPISVTITPSPILTLSQSYISLPIGVSADLPDITSCTNCIGATTWKDELGTTVTSIPPKAQAGFYNYYVSASNGSCVTQRSIVINVYDEDNPCRLEKRVYASSSSSSANTTNANNAYDGNPQTRSTLTATLGLLGLGAAHQTLQWSSPIPAGTKITIKLNVGASVLALGSNVNVQPYLGGATVGGALPINGGLIQLLSGENDIYFSFIASASIDRVRINVSALLGLGITAHSYDAWYMDEDEDGLLDCANGDVLDILAGSVELISGVLNAASATITIVNPWNAVDGNENTFAQINSVLGLAAYAQLTVVFSSVSAPGDSLYIVTSTGGSLLGLNLLDGFVIQRYFGDTPVGEPIDANNSLLDLKLLSGGTLAAVILKPTPEPYDKIQIRYGGVANVLNNIRINEIYRVAGTEIEGADVDNKIAICEGENIQLVNNEDMCTTYRWYDAPTGGTLIEEGLSFLPTEIGTYTYYIQPFRYGCETLKRGIVDIIVLPKPGKPHMTITDIQN